MDQSQAQPSVSDLRVVNPHVCRMWCCHMRAAELITDQSCKEEIESFAQHGQKQPVLGRLIRGDSRYQIELIYGARRLFVAQQLNVGLLVRVRELNDREAFVEMDIENRMRRNVSPYERGMAYKEWLRNGYFASRKDIAATLSISLAQISRLLKFAELPAVVVRAFGDPASIRESWAGMLVERCQDPDVKLKMTTVARQIASGAPCRDPAEVLKQLLGCKGSRRPARSSHDDTVVHSSEGQPLFRISYRKADVHIILPRNVAGSETIESAAELLKRAFEGEADCAVKTRRPLSSKAERAAAFRDTASSPAAL